MNILKYFVKNLCVIMPKHFQWQLNKLGAFLPGNLSNEKYWHLAHSLITFCPGFIRPLSRAHVRLLGPCFKTGQTVADNIATDPRRRYVGSAVRPDQVAEYSTARAVPACRQYWTPWVPRTLKKATCNKRLSVLFLSIKLKHYIEGL